MSTARSIGLVAALVSAAGAGFVAGSMLQPAETQSPADHRSGAAASVESKLNLILEEIRARPVASEPSREPVGTDSQHPDLSQLPGMVAELLQRVTEITGTSFPLRAPATSNGEAIASLYASLPNERRSSPGLDASSPMFGRPLSSLMIELGAPQRVLSDSGSQLVLEYQVDSTRAVEVICSQGYVVSTRATQPFLKRERERLQRQVDNLRTNLPLATDDEERKRMASYLTVCEQALARLDAPAKR